MRPVLFNDQRRVLSYIQTHLDRNGRFAFYTEDIAAMALALSMPVESLGDILAVMLNLGVLRRVDRDFLEPKHRAAA